MTDETLYADTLPVPAEPIHDYLKWLSELQSAHQTLSNSDPLVGRCQQIEEVISRQSAEIEALREMLASEHDRHERKPRHSMAGGESGFLRSIWCLFQ